MNNKSIIDPSVRHVQPTPRGRPAIAAMRILAYIARCCADNNGVYETTSREVGAAFNLSPHAIQRFIRRLARKGLLIKEIRHNADNNGDAGLRITLTPLGQKSVSESF